MELKKIQFKTNSGWVHFCYLDEKAYAIMVKAIVSVTDQIKVWAEQDFGITQVDTPEDLALLKEAIKDHCRDLYPNIYIESPTDKQGWARVWLTERIFKEVNEHGS